LEEVKDPTGAGDSFAGGFLGYLDGLDSAAGPDDFRRAMAYGTVLASFNVEEFGTERVSGLERDEIEARLGELRAMTHLRE
jgi:sugar/nucleoside kinase (ribokinase family)